MTTPTVTATPNDLTSASRIGLAAGVSGSVGVILVPIFIVVFISIQRKSRDDPEGKRSRCFSWKPKEDVETGRYTRQPKESYAMTTPRIHVSQNEQFHAGDTPELRQQIAVPNGSRNHSSDPLEPIYNVSINSGRSSESTLSSISCPRSPAVSSIHEEDVSTSESPYQPGQITLIDDEYFITGQNFDPHKESRMGSTSSVHSNKTQLTRYSRQSTVANKALAQDNDSLKTDSTPDYNETSFRTTISSQSKRNTQISRHHLSQYTGSDSGYTGSAACTSHHETTSSTCSHDLVHATTGNRRRAWSPTSCLTDISSYEMVYEMFRSQITPECVTPTATLSDCTSKGVKYFDETNDFGLEIPEGAIPEGERITIDIGVALYGPFQYPEGLRPVSPVFWVCVRDQKLPQFLEPVKVTIPHFLNLETPEDIESLGLTFLKGDHEMNSQQMYRFYNIAGNACFEPLKRHGVLQTTHFCYLCISSKISRKLIRRAKFCVCAAIPCVMSPRQPAYVYFFATFLLRTCLDTLKKQIRKMPELQEHIKKEHDFQFSKHSHDPALGITLPHTSPAGWTVGLQFNKQVSLNEM